MKAYTTNTNTPASDLLAEVLHTVELDNGQKITLMAIDPPDAIKKAQTLQFMHQRYQIILGGAAYNMRTKGELKKYLTSLGEEFFMLGNGGTFTGAIAVLDGVQALLVAQKFTDAEMEVI